MTTHTQKSESCALRRPESADFVERGIAVEEKSREKLKSFLSPIHGFQLEFQLLLRLPRPAPRF